MVYNAAFERGVIMQLAEQFDDLAPALRRMATRLFDLLPLARENYYHPAMMGSWSIKRVLPTIAPDLDYGNLESVQSGDMVEPVYFEMVDAETTAERKAELGEALLTYCERDTLGMVRVAEFFSGAPYPQFPISVSSVCSAHWRTPNPHLGLEYQRPGDFGPSRAGCIDILARVFLHANELRMPHPHDVGARRKVEQDRPAFCVGLGEVGRFRHIDVADHPVVDVAAQDHYAGLVESHRLRNAGIEWQFETLCRRKGVNLMAHGVAIGEGHRGTDQYGLHLWNEFLVDLVDDILRRPRRQPDISIRWNGDDDGVGQGLAVRIGDRGGNLRGLRVRERRRDRGQHDYPARKHVRQHLKSIRESQGDRIGLVFETLRGAREVVVVRELQRRPVR